MVNYILMGMPCSGKIYLGHYLKQKYQYSHCDMDELFASKFNM